MQSTRVRVVDGRIQARRLECNVVEHCNLACRACSHLSPVLAKRHIDVDVLHRDLTLMSRHYHARWLRLLGGEPLLHPGLVEIVRRARESRVADAICVVTNGVLLPRMGPDFWESVDRVEVSLYRGCSLVLGEQIECYRRAEAAGTVIRFSPHEQFRESYSEQGTSDSGVVRAIYDTCRIVHDWQCYTVADGRFFKCPQSSFLPKVVDGCAENARRDSIAITKSDELGRELAAYLEATEPLQSCGFCLGTAGKVFSHGQVRRREFRALQRHPAEALLEPGFLRRLGRAE